MAKFSNYGEWVRATLAQARSRPDGLLIPMFDSHPAEPVKLVHDIVAAGFCGSLTDRYTSAFSGGNPYVIAQLKQRYACSSEQILTTTGASNAIGMILRALTQAGDEVLVENPGFDLFALHAGTVGVGVRYFDRIAPDYRIDLDDIAARITPRTRLLILSNLHNPTGTLIDAADMASLAQLLETANIHALVDEVYLGYGPDDKAVAGCTLSDRFISISSMTKLYSLSSLRCGWIVAEPKIMDRIRAVSNQFDYAVSNLSHAVAAMVLENDAPFVAYSRGVIASALPVVKSYYDQWREAGLVEGPDPRFGCVSFPKLVGVQDTEAFSLWLAQRNGVIVAPGEYFGTPGHVRLSHAKPVEKLRSSLDALTEGLNAYRDLPLRQREAIAG
ncbi:Aspartate/methionine/tyrosine aminotransferase [Sphingobium sp. AP50]|uniref:pyridoxal phosphate-dependent aminotransferase n=1 Tax=Sphingobium sp. AP50 TaxID=1884369 RepID=UPI0008C7B576|nr:pyridoxal phosphate-dependent aminotransferase [Sphingobium sp. AP50]SEJ73977.1 Aspartate/methionine/tyrosine aminotransferase [Sphingobium sp. AP50]